MSKRSMSWVLAMAGLAMIGGTAYFLSRFEGMQRLGAPGVKLEARNVYDDSGAIVATNAVYLPTDLPGYQSTNTPITRVELDWLPKDTTFGRVSYLASNGFAATLSAVLMGADRTSIHKPEYCLVGQGLRVESQEIVAIPISEPTPYPLQVMKMKASGEMKGPDGTTQRVRAIFVYWFVADGQLAADHNKRMLSMLVDMVRTGVLQRWAYISCVALCEPGQEDAAFADVQRLVAAAVPRFQLVAGKSVQVAQGR